MSIRFTLYGDVPSKKNQRILTMIHGRPMSLPSKNYKLWHKEASRQLQTLNIAPVTSACFISLMFYSSTKRKADLSNKVESVNDLLVDNGILEDDNWECLPKTGVEYGGHDKNNPRVEITILPYERA